MSEVAKAYIQLVPSASGIKGAITAQLGGEAESAGISAGGRIAGAIKKAIAAAGIGTAIKEALNEGAALQQSIGGIETLFKDSADTVRRYANEAYKSAGLSANAYMEQVTSFSASLLQSLGGDTARAAEAANQAVIDMADNANKMGTSIESIQNAYQGFAKQNYTMLDNLKLGYGGTKEEMQRLLADAEKLTGIKYDIGNLNDVYSAIHVIQGELGITGTTAAEAEKTFTGSFAAMKSAAQNFLGALALGEDIKPALDALQETTVTFLRDNLFPMLGNIIESLFGSEVYNAVSTIASALLGALQVLTQFVTWLNGGSTSAEVFKVAVEAIAAAILVYKGVMLALTIAENAATIAQLALNAAMALNPVGLVIAAVAALIVIIIALVKNFDTVKETFANMWEGIKEGGQRIIATIQGTVDKVKAFLSGLIDSALNWGRDLIDNFVQGIKERIQKVIDTVKGIAENIKSYLGFSEPELGPLADFHTFAPDMMELFAQGIRQNARLITDAVDSTFDFGPKIVDYGFSGARAPSFTSPRGEAAPTAAAPERNITLLATIQLDGATLWQGILPYKRMDEAMTGVPLI